MDDKIRNKLRNVVTQCRKLLEDAIAQELEGKYTIFAKKNQVTADPDAEMPNLNDEEQAARKDILDHFAHIKARGFKPKEALDQLVREIAFTHLNRLCAYKMMEARDVYVGGQKFREAVSRGVNSNGVKFYLADHEDDLRLFETGQQDVAYRHFLDWLGGLLSDEIGVLFSPTDPANRLYPRQKTIDEVLDLLNGGGIKPDETELKEQWPTIWSQDETIGWVYQYFTPKELRDKARKESSAPRNSYELAFRNQFFTPRYVVEFLTDNTLGRIWYEMRQGDTRLKDECTYMVRRPTEVFLDEGQAPPDVASGGSESADDLPQEELLKLPVHIPHRPKKDPRDLKILDPACGSGHFLLYCFDLLLTIYEEAYDDPDLGPALQRDYSNLDDLRRDVPRLILAHNLHGIDIDLRASQIAALALWLRCQRAYQQMGLKKDRPKITRSNLVCAEPMPGEEGLLEEFLKSLHEERLPKLIRRVLDVPADQPVRATAEMADRLCELVRLVWDRMQLAGEAGSLLKIEEDLQAAIRKGQAEWEEAQPLFRVRHYGLTADPEEKYVRFVPGEGVSFWERAEALVMAALDDFATYAANGRKLQRKLFVDDAVRGFAFVDLCRQRFDVVLMNPPFGASAERAKTELSAHYPNGKSDLFACFIERAISLLTNRAFYGAITNRTGFFLSSLEKWRTASFLENSALRAFADLGHGVLDTAMVETAAYTAQRGFDAGYATFLRVIAEPVDDKAAVLDAQVLKMRGDGVHLASPSDFTAIPGSPFAYWINNAVRSLFESCDCLEDRGFKTCQGLITADDPRFLRLDWERPGERAKCVSDIEGRAAWSRFAKGGEFSPFYSSIYMVADCSNGFRELIDNANNKYPYLKGGAQKMLHAVPELFFSAGLNYTRRTTSEFSVRALPRGCVFSDKGPAILPSSEKDDLLSLLAVLNSRAFRGLLSLSLGAADAAARSYETGIVSTVPLPEVDESHRESIRTLAKKAWACQRFASLADETSPVFFAPAVLQVAEGRTDASLQSLVKEYGSRAEDCLQQVAEAMRQIDKCLWECYGLDEEDQKCLCTALTLPEEGAAGDEIDEDMGVTDAMSLEVAACHFVQYCAGVAFGRWDVRQRGDQCADYQVHDPFQALPAYSPATLLGENSHPSGRAPHDYPLTIDADGILVDNPENQDDVVRRVRDVLEVIWKDRADAIEQEACEILGVKTLRDYFRKPGKGGFWDDHVKRYSKSRRKAPIYWLLQSSRKNYALWLYYHRLDKDLLFKALQSSGPVQSKINLEQNKLDELYRLKKEAGDSSKETKRLAKEVEKQEDFLSELRDFEDKLRRAADLHLDPDLNDGVVLNIAPLHELVPWKVAKKYWDDLLAGKYEWSSIGQQLRARGLVK